MRFFRHGLTLLLVLVVPCASASWASAQSKRQKPPIKKSAAASVANSQKLGNGLRECSSANFHIRTDLSEVDSDELLARLEKMLSLVETYYGKPNSQTIEMNVIEDKDRWPAELIPGDALNSIRVGGGITLSSTLAMQNAQGEQQITSAKSVVWAAAQRGVPQHEAVHAYCHQNFGRTGPTWYSEGMAELGKYWRDKDESVQIDPHVLKYLMTSELKQLTEITASGQQTGDGWQNYAWRWALCQLLSTNPNYSPRFKPLGMALLSNQKARFEDVYGPMAKEISFEYEFFLKHLAQGYRCDLCAWDWKTKCTRLRGTGTAQAKISANRGWQCSRVMLKSGDRIEYSTTGEWFVEKGSEAIGAAGNDAGKGRLVGILFKDYQLSEPFELGTSGEYVAETDGNLFVRCRDDWGDLADNSGAITVRFKVAN